MKTIIKCKETNFYQEKVLVLNDIGINLNDMYIITSKVLQSHRVLLHLQEG